MKVVDKISWHVDAGENLSDHIHRFQVILDFLNTHSMLSTDGKEVLEIGIDSATSLNSKMLTPAGLAFCECNANMLVGIEAETLGALLMAMEYIEYKQYATDIAMYILGYGEKYSSTIINEMNELKYNMEKEIGYLSEKDKEKIDVLRGLLNIINNHPTIRAKKGL